MSIELKQAAQQALNALDEATTYTGSPWWSPSMTDECIAAASALRAALSQQPATGEPVWCVATGERVNGEETYTHHDAYVPLADCFPLYTHPAPSVPATPEPVAWFEYSERHKSWFLAYTRNPHVPTRPLVFGDTHPAPSVPADVVRDAERYRWLKAYDHNSEDMGICKWVDEGWSGQWVLEHDPDTSIDAAKEAK